MTIEDIHRDFEKEREKTKECLADVQQLLSHDTSSTRKQLIEVLQGRIALIRAEISLDRFD